ncbi:MAG: ribosome maturation factor RimM [Parvibaculum sp.]
MTTAPQDPLVVLGVIAGAHGVSGRVRINAYTQTPEGVGEYGPVCVGSQTYKIKVTGVSKGQALCELEGVKDRNAAESLKGLEVSVVRDALPADGATEDDWFQSDLVGLRVETASGELLGLVEGVHNFGASDLLEIAPAQGGTTVLMAFTADNVPAIDVEGGRLVADPPIGTFDEPGEGPAPKKRRRSPKARARLAAQNEAAQDAAGDGADDA